MRKNGDVTFSRTTIAFITLVILLTITLTSIISFIYSLEGKLERIENQVEANKQELDFRRDIIFNNKENIAVLLEKIDKVDKNLEKILEKVS